MFRVDFWRAFRKGCNKIITTYHNKHSVGTQLIDAEKYNER